MDRTRSAAVLTLLGALALLTLPPSPAGADDTETDPVPFGRCDVYRPATGARSTGVDRCVTGMTPAGATVELPAPACPDVVSIPADGDVAFYIGGCPPEPPQTHTTGAAATAEPVPPPRPSPPPARPAAPASSTTTTTSSTTTTSTTFVAPPPPTVLEPTGGGSAARPATADVVTDPAASARLTSVGRPATVERDHSPLVMLFALALLAVALLGVSRLRSERP